VVVSPTAVVFDNDGLFLDTEDAWTRAEVRLFNAYDSTFTAEHKRDLIGSSHLIAAGKLEQMLQRPGDGLRLMAELHELVMEEALGELAPRPGAIALVDALRAVGTPVGLASNSPRDFVERTLHSAGVGDRFDVIVAGDEVEHPKPAPDIYLAACAALGVVPGHAVAIEDSPPGIAAARAAGMTVIGVPYLDDLELDADVVATSLADPAVHAACGL
jgi:HAD superfamily hydrolase (TIGR01509 family)